jgi:predicted HicB family RNase H-like nuclease
MIKQVSEEELRKPLTEQQKREIRALEDMPDSEIDFSDIPEIRELPPGAVRGLFYRGHMIRLPEELRRYFADLAARKRVPMNDIVVETLQKALAVIEVAR